MAATKPRVKRRPAPPGPGSRLWAAIDWQRQSLSLNRRWPWVIAGTVVALAVVAGAAYILIRAKNASPDGSLTSVKMLVGRHYLLPTDEQPALATITDPAKLTTPFLKQGRAGDRILIYQQHQIAIIYRPSVDRIVAVGPVSIDKPQQPAPRQ